MADWTREEVEAIVDDYRHMLIQDLNGQPYNKAMHNRRLQGVIHRTHGSIERKHQNISAVLRDADCFYINGYKPLGNYQAMLVDVVERRLLMDINFDRCALNVSEKLWLPPVDQHLESMLVDAPRPPLDDSEVQDRPTKSFHRPIKRDYLAREAKNRALGLEGEKLVMDYEIFKLNACAKYSLAKKVEHASVARGDGLGYDILSYEPNGKERFIEVKTTAFGIDLPFYISQNEIDFSTQEHDRFHLYRVFEMRHKPKMFILNGDMRKQLVLDPFNYRASVAPS